MIRLKSSEGEGGWRGGTVTRQGACFDMIIYDIRDKRSVLTELKYAENISKFGNLNEFFN